MKKLFALLFFIFTTSFAFAQTQQGIVKTRGRVVNGKVVPGTKLSGATITLSIGNPQVSQAQGTFSFNVPTGKSYSLLSAKKPGYTLADPEYTRRTFKYSAGTPFYVVLEDEAQRQADINAATRKVRRTLTAQLQKREDEIEALKEQHKLTEQEYQRRIKDLYDAQDMSQHLVKEMAERYASTDYDQLDEFQQQIQLYIEEGELQKADSLIRCKGDLRQRVEEYHNVVAANQKARQQLEQSEAGALQTYKDLSQDLLRRSEIFMQTFQQDSALHCLKMRADLDTTDVEAVFDYALLCYKQHSFLESKRYYHISLRSNLLDSNAAKKLQILNNLATLYNDMRDYENSEKYFLLALQAAEALSVGEAEKDLAYRATIENNIGSLYLDMHDYANCEKYLLLAMEDREQLSKLNPDIYRIDIMMTLENLGSLYSKVRNYTKGEMYYRQALEHLEYLFQSNPDSYRAQMATTLNNLGNLYNSLKDYAKSENYYLKSIEYREILFRENAGAYRDALATTQNNLGTLYISTKQYENAEKYLLKALEHRGHLFSMAPDAYRSALSGTQHNLGYLYSVLQDYENSEKYYKLALQNKMDLFNHNPNAYRANMVSTLTNLGLLYRNLKDYSNSEKYYKLALENYETLYSQNGKPFLNGVVSTMRNLALLYIDTATYTEAMAMVEKGIELMPSAAQLYAIKGDILLMQDRNDEALEMWKKVLELDPNFLDNYPDGTNLSDCLKKLGLIE